MWLDVTDDGACHAGIDAFLSRALGHVERITYVWQQGQHRPTAVITADGVDLEVVFPNPLLLTNCNLYLRADPSRLTAEPYTGGWLFEGMPEPDTTRRPDAGRRSAPWMEQEQHRMNEFLQTPSRRARGRWRTVRRRPGAPSCERDQMLALFHEFFSPLRAGKREL